MSAIITQITISPEELAEIVRKELERHTERMAAKDGDEWTTLDVARHYNVSEHTVRRWEKAGKLPPRIGRHWSKADILRFRRERRWRTKETSEGHKKGTGIGVMPHKI